MAIERKKRVNKKRRQYATVNERVLMLKYVKYCCFKKLKVTSTYLLKMYHTGDALRLLIKKGVINRTSSKDVFYWNAATTISDVEFRNMAFTFWKKHSKEISYMPIAAPQLANTVNMPTLPGLDFDPGNDYITRREVMQHLKECFEACNKFGCTNYIVFITSYMNDKLGKQ